MIRVVQVLTAFLFAAQIGFAQNADQYYTPNSSAFNWLFPYGGFDDNENLIVCADDKNHQRIQLLKYDTNRVLIDSAFILCDKPECGINKVFVGNNRIYITMQEYSSWTVRSLRLVVLDDIKTVIKDTVFEPPVGQIQNVNEITKAANNDILISATVPSQQQNGGSGMYRFTSSGSLINKVILPCGSVHSIYPHNNSDFVIPAGRFIDSNGVIRQNAALILDSSFNVVKSFRADSSERHILDFQNNLQVTYQPASITDHTTVVPLNGDFFGIISTFRVDSFDMRSPGPSFNRKIGIRVGVTDSKDSLISEHFQFNDSLYTVSAFTNSERLIDGSFLTFGVTGASEGYDMFLPIRSSYILSKYDATGEFVWSKSFSQKNYYYHATEVVASKTGRIAILGTAFDYSDTHINYGNVLFVDSNGVIEKQQGIGIQEIDENPISVFPNPSTGEFNVLMDNETSAVLLVTNSTGQQVFQTPLLEKHQTVQIGDLPPGIYFYQIIGEAAEILKTGKLVKH